MPDEPAVCPRCGEQNWFEVVRLLEKAESEKQIGPSPWILFSIARTFLTLYGLTVLLFGK
jgi:hypothetical protein